MNSPLALIIICGATLMLVLLIAVGVLPDAGR